MFEFHLSISYKTQPGPVAKNATLGHPAGNRTRDLANLVRYSANWATEARFARSRVQFPAGWPKVAFFVAGPS